MQDVSFVFFFFLRTTPAVDCSSRILLQCSRVPRSIRFALRILRPGSGVRATYFAAKRERDEPANGHRPRIGERENVTFPFFSPPSRPGRVTSQFCDFRYTVHGFRVGRCERGAGIALEFRFSRENIARSRSRPPRTPSCTRAQIQFRSAGRRRA